MTPVAGVPVTATVMRFNGVHSTSFPEALKTLDVRLGTLTPGQFEAVKASFGNASTVKYDAQRDYRAVDFLPPAVQALIGRDLDRQPQPAIPGTELIGSLDPRMRGNLDIRLAPNCHGTAWEVARAFQGQARDSVALFYGDPIRMDNLVSSSGAFRKLGTVTGDRLSDLKPGDLVQFKTVEGMRTQTSLLHSAVYVGNGLFVDKPHTEGSDVHEPAKYADQEETPYRLVTLEMMSKPLSESSRFRFEIEAWRPTGPIPQAEPAFGSNEAFSSSSQEMGRGFLEKLKAHVATQGASLNMPLVVNHDLGSNGFVRTVGADALLRVPIRTAADGTATID